MSPFAEASRTTFDLPARLLNRLVKHAQGSWPEECCGILVGSVVEGGRAFTNRAIAVENVSSGPRERRYVVPPLAILRAQRQARQDGLEIVGYYHSHPSGSAVPSALDRRNAWPDISYVILGMRGRELAEVRSWRLGSGTGFVEEALNCEHENDESAIF